MIIGLHMVWSNADHTPLDLQHMFLRSQYTETHAHKTTKPISSKVEIKTRWPDADDTPLGLLLWSQETRTHTHKTTKPINSKLEIQTRWPDAGDTRFL